MSVIWEKGVVSVLAERCCSTLLWFGLVERCFVMNSSFVSTCYLHFLSGIWEDGSMSFCCSDQHYSCQSIQYLSSEGNDKLVTCYIVDSVADFLAMCNTTLVLQCRRQISEEVASINSIYMYSTEHA